jgi:hypothetical protein
MTTHAQNVRYESRTYVVLCYARTKKTWFSADDYRLFQQHNRKLLDDIGKSFGSLVKHGYLEQTGRLSKARYKITQEGVNALGHIGLHRVKTEHEKMCDRVRNNATISGAREKRWADHRAKTKDSK